MTVKQLHAQLGALIEKKMGRLPVHVLKSSFTHPLEEDGCVLLPVEEVSADSYPISDADGGTEVDSRGREKYQNLCVIKGMTQREIDVETAWQKELSRMAGDTQA